MSQQNEVKHEEFHFNEPVELQEWYDIGADIRVNIRKQFSRLNRAYDSLKEENLEIKKILKFAQQMHIDGCCCHICEMIAKALAGGQDDVK